MIQSEDTTGYSYDPPVAVRTHPVTGQESEWRLWPHEQVTLHTETKYGHAGLRQYFYLELPERLRFVSGTVEVAQRSGGMWRLYGVRPVTRDDPQGPDGALWVDHFQVLAAPAGADA